MARRRVFRESRIFFPWESRGGFLRGLRLSRVRPLFFFALLVVAVLSLGLRARQQSSVRQTRATLIDARHVVERYLAEHEGACPESLAAAYAAVGSRGSLGNDAGPAARPAPQGSPGPLARLATPPVDAWGRPLRLWCPATREGVEFELMSDGPDGEPGGLDRIE